MTFVVPYKQLLLYLVCHKHSAMVHIEVDIKLKLNVTVGSNIQLDHILEEQEPRELELQTAAVWKNWRKRIHE